jgi:transcriptional regulator
MNTLTVEQQRRILSLLEEGKSLREIERITGHRRETISLYGRLAGLHPRRNSGSAPNALAA